MSILRLYVHVPLASFRVAEAREYWETYPVAPPATVFGMLLAFVGEELRQRHAGAEIALALCSAPRRSVVLRSLWRVKDNNYWQDPTGRAHIVSKGSQIKAGTWTDPDGRLQAIAAKTNEQGLIQQWAKQKGWDASFEFGPGLAANRAPGFQELLTGITLAVWLRAGQERPGAETLASRLEAALADPAGVARFGGLSLGESTHLVNDVRRWRERPSGHAPADPAEGRLLLRDPGGPLSLPVWPDHVGSARSRFAAYRLSEPTGLPALPAENAWTCVRPPGLAAN